MDIQYQFELQLDKITLPREYSRLTAQLPLPQGRETLSESISVPVDSEALQLGRMRPFSFVSSETPAARPLKLRIELHGESQGALTVPLNVNKLIKFLKEGEQIYHSETYTVNSGSGELQYTLNIQPMEIMSPSRRLKPRLSTLHKVESVKVPLKNGFINHSLQPASAQRAEFRVSGSLSVNSVDKTDKVDELVHSHSKGSELYENQKTTMKVKIVIILISIGLLFALFDALTATEEMNKSGKIYKKGRKGRRKQREK